MKQSVPMRVTQLRQYLKGILKFSVLHEEKVVKEEKSSFDTLFKKCWKLFAEVVERWLLLKWYMILKCRNLSQTIGLSMKFCQY